MGAFGYSGVFGKGGCGGVDGVGGRRGGIQRERKCGQKLVFVFCYALAGGGGVSGRFEGVRLMSVAAI